MSGAITINPLSSTTRYPFDLQVDGETDYIRFQFYEYKPPFTRAGEGAAGYYQTNREGNLGPRKGPDILMYMPQDVSTSMSTSWGGKEISNVAAGLLSGYANTASADGKGALQNLQTGMKNMASAIPTTAGAALVNMGLQATGAQGNLGMNDILGGTAGVILNPNTELLFGGPSIRNIGFKFKMAARSEKEARSMLRICRKFQYHASSKMGASTDLTENTLKGLQTIGNLAGNVPKENNLSDEKIKEWATSNNFISIPDLCLFKYMTGSDQNTYLNQYKACAITNVDVNFTPDGSYSTLIGGYPSAIELSINLVETKIIYRTEIQRNPDLVSN